MSYTISQKLNQYPTDPNAWDDDITANSGANYFIAVTSNEIGEGDSQRVMTVIMIANYDATTIYSHCL